MGSPPKTFPRQTAPILACVFFSRNQEMALVWVQRHYSQTNLQIEDSPALIYSQVDQDFDHMNMGLYHRHSCKCLFL